MEFDALKKFPGGDLVAKGLSDLKGDLLSEEALLVCVASPRLRGLGMNVPEPKVQHSSFEHALYEAIEGRLPRGAHVEYNALIGRIVSFANAYR